MTVFYELRPDDYLAHQLYAASSNPRIRHQRTRSWITMSLSMLIISFVFYDSGKDLFFYMLLAMSALAMIFFPLYLRWYYEKFYRRHVEDYFKDRFNIVCRLAITDTTVESHDPYCDISLRFAGLTAITEVPAYYYIALKTGGHLIVPKSVPEAADLREALIRVSRTANIPFVDALNWKWK